MVSIDDIVDDLEAEGRFLESLLTPLEDPQWKLGTPSEGWTVAHQVGHLLWTDEAACHSLLGDESFDTTYQSWAASPETYVDRVATTLAKTSPQQLLTRWRGSRQQLALLLREADPNSSVRWFGPPMKPKSMATARLMETWAHGHDIADALGEPYPETAALQHIAHLGVRTRAFSYQVKGLTSPDTPIRIELTGPDGELWTWGPSDAPADRVTGPAVDFCLVVTQRRRLEDMRLTVDGSSATEWLQLAQAFAGKPTTTPRNRSIPA